MNVTYTSEPVDLTMMYSAETFTIIFLYLLGLLTTAFNAFTLYAIYKDPLSCFRTPLTTFITGIIISDLLTGMIVEPAVASVYAISRLNNNLTYQTYLNIVRTAQIFALITMNTSFLTFLALAIAQLLAVGWTGVYERYVTTKTAKIAIGVIWLYSVFFSLIPEIGKVSLRSFYALDLILNTTIVTVLLIITYIVTYIVFKKKVSQVLESEQAPEQDNHRGRRGMPKVERDFLIGTFLLTCILIITVLPFTIALYFWIFEKKRSFATVVKRYVAVIICENILFLKFLWDPAILILRIPTYRKSVVMIFSGTLGNNPGGIVAYNRHADEQRADNFIPETTVMEENIREDREDQEVKT